jgi:hypothetical protein
MENHILDQRSFMENQITIHLANKISNLLFEIYDVLISSCQGRTFKIYDDIFKDLDMDGTGFLDVPNIERKLRELR